jgi:hypothetical protein
MDFLKPAFHSNILFTQRCGTFRVTGCAHTVDIGKEDIMAYPFTFTNICHRPIGPFCDLEPQCAVCHFDAGFNRPINVA